VACKDDFHTPVLTAMPVRSYLALALKMNACLLFIR
jgi:hypothetical protein